MCRLAKNCQTYAHSTKDWVHLPYTNLGGSENGRHTDADLYHFIQNVECVRKKGKILRKELSW